MRGWDFLRCFPTGGIAPASIGHGLCPGSLAAFMDRSTPNGDPAVLNMGLRQLGTAGYNPGRVDLPAVRLSPYGQCDGDVWPGAKRCRVHLNRLSWL